VPTPVLSLIVAPLGLDRVAVNVSVDSATASSRIGTESAALVPAGNVSVPPSS
jgi:hypothetical protein